MPEWKPVYSQSIHREDSEGGPFWQHSPALYHAENPRAQLPCIAAALNGSAVDFLGATIDFYHDATACMPCMRISLITEFRQ
jgi:hypothetical protein